jgi:hypothetical protein
VISDLSIDSHHVNANGTLSSTLDVTISRWEVEPYRTDGGTVASPRWINDESVYIPAGGTADLKNYRVFPAEYFLELPLSNLLPENGGFDPETGSRNIRQALQITLYGTTNSGKSVDVTFTAQYNFFCNS